MSPLAGSIHTASTFSNARPTSAPRNRATREPDVRAASSPKVNANRPWLLVSAFGRALIVALLLVLMISLPLLSIASASMDSALARKGHVGAVGTSGTPAVWHRSKWNEPHHIFYVSLSLPILVGLADAQQNRAVGQQGESVDAG